jgi:SepF-like predicted cell division protein (DUF552 family)
MGLLHDLVDDLKKIVPKKGEEAKIEEELQQLQPTINLRIEGIKSLQDVERVLEFLKGGDIVFIKSKVPTMEDYRNVVKRLKDFCTEINGDIIGIGENNLIVVPSNVKIVR